MTDPIIIVNFDGDGDNECVDANNNDAPLPNGDCGLPDAAVSHHGVVMVPGGHSGHTHGAPAPSMGTDPVAAGVIILAFVARLLF